MYRFEATSLPGFIQQLAVSYVGRGYFFYVTGWIPKKKAPETIDQKLLGRYDIAISKWARVRRKAEGKANLHYLRFGRFFVLVATHGRHHFFVQEASVIRDVRRVPIKIGGYSVSYRGGHPHVRIAQDEYNRLKSYFVGISVSRSVANLERELMTLSFEPYAPVRRQFLNLHRAVNRARRTAGFDLVPINCLRLRRRVYRPFEPLKLLSTRDVETGEPAILLDDPQEGGVGLGPPGEAEAGTGGTQPAEE